MPPPAGPGAPVPAPERMRPRRPASPLPSRGSSPAASRSRPAPPSPPIASPGRARAASSPRIPTSMRCTVSWDLRYGHPAVDRPDAPSPRQREQRVDVQLLDLREIGREAGDPEERIHDGALVRGLAPPEGGEEGVGADLPHNLLRLPPRQRGDPERDVLQQLNVYPRHPQHEQGAELRVPAHP